MNKVFKAAMKDTLKGMQLYYADERYQFEVGGWLNAICDGVTPEDKELPETLEVAVESIVYEILSDPRTKETHFAGKKKLAKAVETALLVEAATDEEMNAMARDFWKLDIGLVDTKRIK